MIECVVYRMVEFRTGALYSFRRSVWLPHPPMPGIRYTGLMAAQEHTHEFAAITYDINKNKYVCAMQIIIVDNGDGLMHMVKYFGPDWIHWPAHESEPA